MVGIDLDTRVILFERVARFFEAVSQASDGLAESLSSDQHVSCLGDLHLISVLAEERALRVEVINGHIKLGHSGISWRSGVSRAEVVMIGVHIVVIRIQGRVLANDTLRLGLSLGGESGGGEQSKRENFHFVSLLDAWVRIMS